MKIRGRSEPGDVAKSWDDLWIVVKCQSNLAIAGSPRNSFRASTACMFLRVEH